MWMEPHLRGHLSYKATFSWSQGWPHNICLTVLLIRNYRCLLQTALYSPFMNHSFPFRLRKELCICSTQRSDACTCYFKNILLFNNRQLDRTQVSFSNTYMNQYKMSFYNMICIFHIQWRHETPPPKKNTHTSNNQKC